MTDLDHLAQLFALYAWAFDGREHHRLADVFADDARLEVTLHGRTIVGPIDGKQALLESLTPPADSTSRQERHQITNILRENETTARATLTLITSEKASVTVKLVGAYTVETVVERGALRFRSVLLALDGIA